MVNRLAGYIHCGYCLYYRAQRIDLFLVLFSDSVQQKLPGTKPTVAYFLVPVPRFGYGSTFHIAFHASMRWIEPIFYRMWFQNTVRFQQSSRLTPKNTRPARANNFLFQRWHRYEGKGTAIYRYNLIRLQYAGPKQ